MGIEVGFGRSQRPTERPRVVGIDLGTTNSLAASMNEEGAPVILRGGDGTRIVPSILSFRDGEVDAVGETARRRLLEDPANAVYSVKRLMGRALEDMESRKFDKPGSQFLNLVAYGKTLAGIVRENNVRPQSYMPVLLDGTRLTPL